MSGDATAQLKPEAMTHRDQNLSDMSDDATAQLMPEAMTHRAQNLSDQQSRVKGHGAAKENNHGLSARDLILKDLLVFGSVLLVVSAILYLIF
jgi:hypothetical protein